MFSFLRPVKYRNVFLIISRPIWSLHRITVSPMTHCVDCRVKLSHVWHHLRNGTFIRTSLCTASPGSKVTIFCRPASRTFDLTNTNRSEVGCVIDIHVTSHQSHKLPSAPVPLRPCFWKHKATGFYLAVFVSTCGWGPRICLLPESLSDKKWAQKLTSSSAKLTAGFLGKPKQHLFVYNMPSPRPRQWHSDSSAQRVHACIRLNSSSLLIHLSLAPKFRNLC